MLVDVQQRVVHRRTAGFIVPLGNADGDDGSGLTRCFAEAARGGARDGDGIREESGVEIAKDCASSGRNDPDPVGIAWNEALRKNDQLRTRPASLGDPFARALDGRVAVEERRSSLHRRDLDHAAIIRRRP